MRRDGVNTLCGANPGRWFLDWPSRLTPLADLVCFPGAGAGASVFATWVKRLPAFAALIACQLPGRENRIDDAPPACLQAASDAAADALLAIRPEPRPLVLFGHSMGAVLAFEVARRLIDAGREPTAFVASASTPPASPHSAARMDEDSLKRLLIDYDPGNREIIANAELFESLAPALRNDIEILRRHRIEPEAATLGIRACLLAGETDPVVSPGAVARWRNHLSGPVVQRTLPGGHHFPIRESRDAVIDILTQLLRTAIDQRRVG